MATQALDLWDLIHERPELDPHDLADALCRKAGDAERCYRTRLLIRDSMTALRGYWGEAKVAAWLEQCPYKDTILSYCQQEFDKIGFPSLPRRVKEKTKPEKVYEVFDFLGSCLDQETSVTVGGAAALILPGFVERHTDDVEFVGDVPLGLRANSPFRSMVQHRFRLVLKQTNPGELPSGWEERVRPLSTYGRLHVSLIDAHDIFLSRLGRFDLTSLNDRRVLYTRLNTCILSELLRNSCNHLMASNSFRDTARDQWHIYFGEPLPQ